MPALELPDITRRRALTLGDEGRAWLEGLDAMVEGLCRDWQLSLGTMLSGGSEAFVATCTLQDGREAVLKVLVPRGTAEGERAVLMAAGGRGYAELFASDPARRAMLMERLGPSLHSLGWSVEAQIEAMLETLRTAWIVPQCPPGEAAESRDAGASGSAVAPGSRVSGAFGGLARDDSKVFMNGAEKARSLAVFIREMWDETGRGWPAALIEAACACAAEREDSFDPATAVLGHGDGHSANTLLVPDSNPPRFKFVDPDGLFIEPAYDLGILMRDWTDELLAGDPLADGLARCRYLAAHTGVAARAIWQWGFIERVSTGLLLEQLGEIKESRAFRAVAEAWATAEL